MKRLLISFIVLLASFSLHAQSYTETLYFGGKCEVPIVKFLGIPVDGAKSDMIRKLEKKRFKYDSYNDVLSGEFNGAESLIFIFTNGDKVRRVCVTYPQSVSETIIRRNYNRLLNEFKSNSKYVECEEYEPIPSNEDISYEMATNNKTYQAGFVLKPEFDEEAQRYLEEEQKTILTSDDDGRFQRARNFYIAHCLSHSSGKVWFQIETSGVGYVITIYYDNEKNEAHGEDL